MQAGALRGRMKQTGRPWAGSHVSVTGRGVGPGLSTFTQLVPLRTHEGRSGSRVCSVKASARTGGHWSWGVCLTARAAGPGRLKGLHWGQELTQGPCLQRPSPGASPAHLRGARAQAPMAFDNAVPSVPWPFSLCPGQSPQFYLHTPEGGRPRGSPAPSQWRCLCQASQRYPYVGAAGGCTPTWETELGRLSWIQASPGS